MEDESAVSLETPIPLFQAAGVWGVSDKIQGVKYMGNQTGPVWNTWDWSVKTSSSSK